MSMRTSSKPSSFFAMNHFKYLGFYEFDGFIVVANVIQSKIFNIASIYNGIHNDNDIIVIVASLSIFMVNHGTFR